MTTARKAATSDHEVDAREQDWAETLDRLRRFVVARVGDPELAADITQDVLARSIASGALEQVDNVSAWLYRSARNAVIDHYRTRRTLDSDSVLESWPEPDADSGLPNPATRELARCLQPMLRGLRPAARDALTRVDLDGQTHQQAADQLGLSVSGMKSRVQRARRELRDRLTDCCRVDTDGSGAITDYAPRQQGCGCAQDATPEPGCAATPV